MARPKRDAVRQEMADDIKRVAREQMREQGTAGISLRGIARTLDITAPAIYNYYPRLDDLITALLVDAFNAHADAMQAAAESVPGEGLLPRIRAVWLAYRNWAVANVVDFDLMYGNPIPGYQAPADITIPLARRPLELVMTLMIQAQRRGEIAIPAAYRSIPPANANHITEFIQQFGLTVEPALFYYMLIGWTRIHGIVMLEIRHHLAPPIGNVETACAHEIDVLLDALKPRR